MATRHKKTNKQTHNWVIDAVLFVGFLVECVLDLTGLALHQWLGVGLAVLALYHLVTHWTWVTAVTARFFGRTSGQSRLYYVLDVGLALSLSGVMVTGLVISTWLSLPLANYLHWRDWHIITTLASLVLLVVKVAAHWRWVTTTARRALMPPQPVTTLTPAPVAVAGDRRQFLRALGIVGGMAAFSAVHSLRVLVSGAAGPEGDSKLVLDSTAPASAASTAGLAAAPAATLTAPPTATAAPAATTGATATKPVTVATPAVAPTATPTRSTAVASAATGSSAGGSTSTCVVRCSKGCSYPGKCRRYVDANGNRKCDLGECV